MRLHTSAVRSNQIQDIYIKEISAFKPKSASAQDAQDFVVPWNVPKAPSPPKDEISTSEVSEYANAPVEVEAEPASTATDIAVGGDWFPIVEEAEEHH